MAFQQDFLEEDEQQQGQPGEQVLSNESQALNTQGDSGGATGGGGANGGSTTNPNGSGGWTNLVSYVKANEGNDAKMAGDVSTNIGNQATEAQTSSQQYQTKANSMVQENTVTDDGIIEKIKTSPTAITGSPQDREKFEEQWNAYYNGAQDASGVEGYGDTSQKYSQVQNRAQNAQDFYGRFSLLDDAYGRPNYSQGEKNLDSFIIGAGDQGQQALSNINQQYGNYTSGWDGVLDTVNGSIKTAKETTDKTREDTRNAYDGRADYFEDTFTKYGEDATAESASWAQKYEKAVADIQAGKNVGNVDAATVQYLVKNGVSIEDIIQMSEGRKMGDFASDQEEADYRALMDLGKRTSAFNDFSETGLGADDYYRITDAYGAGSQAKAMEEQLAALLAEQQAARDAEYQEALKAISGGGWSTGVNDLAMARSMGLSADDYSYAKRNGIDLTQYLKQGKKLNRGDIANDKQRKQWDALLGTLGAYGYKNSNLRDYQDEGAAYSFDMDAFGKEIGSYRDSDSAKAAKRQNKEQSDWDKIAKYNQHDGKETLDKYEMRILKDELGDDYYKYFDDDGNPKGRKPPKGYQPQEY